MEHRHLNHKRFKIKLLNILTQVIITGAALVGKQVKILHNSIRKGCTLRPNHKTPSPLAAHMHTSLNSTNLRNLVKRTPSLIKIKAQMWLRLINLRKLYTSFQFNFVTTFQPEMPQLVGSHSHLKPVRCLAVRL